MNRKITGWMLCAAAAVAFYPWIGSSSKTISAVPVMVADGSSQYPPTTLPPPKLSFQAALPDGSSQYPPTTLPPPKLSLTAALPDGSSQYPPTTLPPPHTA